MSRAILVSAAGTACAVLLPKCPLCIAAWLAVLGVGAGAGGVIGMLARPLAIAVAVGAFVSWSTRRRRRCCSAR